MVNAGTQNGMCTLWTTEGDRERTRERQRGFQTVRERSVHFTVWKCYW